ncbi:hypothetical protein [Micromonospora sp. RP3T]|uniref:hypothetical protein n=1 Tax=Micromonospora sp. RP3T TaxID=2135446 RepID=UPI003D722F1B
MESNDKTTPVLVVGDAVAELVAGGEHVAVLRRLVAGGRDPQMGIAPPSPGDLARTMRAQRIEQARRIGDVTWRPVRDGVRTALLEDTRTGKVWARIAPGRWERYPAEARRTMAGRVAVLLLGGVDQAEAVAVLLRQDIRPWRELLEHGAEAAVGAGGDRGRVRAAELRTAEVMHDSERRAHRVVLVVEDADTVAGSWYADAMEAGTPDWAAHCRRHALSVEARGVGEFLVGAHPNRAEAVLEAVKLRDGQRPGQSWRVEPVWCPVPADVAEVVDVEDRTWTRDPDELDLWRCVGVESVPGITALTGATLAAMFGPLRWAVDL